MAQELMCKNKHIMFKPFGENFLLHQRLEASVLSPRASACYTSLQDLESKQLLKNLLTTNDCSTQYERFSASILYTLTFGFRILTGEEWQLKRSLECLENFTQASQVGAWIVDAVPSLNSLPAVFTPWKKTAESWYESWADLHMRNMQDALARPGWNWSKDFAAAKEAQQMTPVDISWDLGVLCDAGVETTHTTLQIFTLACLAYPDWIATAQKELDEVVGPNRLPDFDDFEKLPYIQAVVEENFRWRHIVPAGVPHATSQEDTYKGFLIPKGSLIVPLFIAMRNDESLFNNPSEFRPERWLGKPQSSNFGYGRRVCTGRFIARNSVNIAIARLLWAFRIKPKGGERVIVNEESFTPGFVSAPKHFDAVFEVRSELHKRLIEEAYEMAEKDPQVLMGEIRKKQVAVGLTPRA
jgi:hypothetical protein